MQFNKVLMYQERSLCAALNGRRLMPFLEFFSFLCGQIPLTPRALHPLHHRCCYFIVTRWSNGKLASSRSAFIPALLLFPWIGCALSRGITSSTSLFSTTMTTTEVQRQIEDSWRDFTFLNGPHRVHTLRTTTPDRILFGGDRE